MRVRGFSLARLRDDEQGAVLAIVAISLIVLLGMLVLTFDLGHGVALKRNMVNAADAGALAAARECGLANGEVDAKAAAGELVADNNDAATVTGFQIDPGPAQCSGAPNPDPDGRNTVTVTVSVPQEYFFAQIFGFDGGTVVASATAEWTRGVANPAPLKLDVAEVDEDAPRATGSDCYFTFEKAGTGNSGMAQFPRGVADRGRATTPTTCTQGDSKNSGVHRADGGRGRSALQAALWDAPDVGVRRDGVPKTARPGHHRLARQRRPPHRTPGRSSSSRWWRLRRHRCPATDCWTKDAEPGAAYPVVRFQGLTSRGVDTGNDAQEGRTGQCEFADEGPGGRVLHPAEGDRLPSTNPTRDNPTVRLMD